VKQIDLIPKLPRARAGDLVEQLEIDPHLRTKGLFHPSAKNLLRFVHGSGGD